MNKEIFNILINSVNTTQYMTKLRSEKFLKLNNYDDGKNIVEYLESSSKKNDYDIVNQLQEYEYDKNYRYFTLYKYEDNDINKKIQELSDNDINKEEFDYISGSPKKPSIKVYDDEKQIDIKFSLRLESNYNNNSIKFIVMCTVFLEEKLIAIKYNSTSEEYYKEEYYIKTNNRVKKWIEQKLDINMVEFDSMSVYKDLYKNIKMNKEQYQNVSIHSISMDDELNGRTYFRATDDEMLPFVDAITKLTETFECENDKIKVLDYIKRYEDEAIIRNIALKWKNNFKNNKGKRLGSITVGITKVYSVNNVDNQLKYEFLLHHVKQDESVNRERINYAIKYLSRHINKNKEQSKD